MTYAAIGKPVAKLNLEGSVALYLWGGLAASKDTEAANRISKFGAVGVKADACKLMTQVVEQVLACNWCRPWQTIDYKTLEKLTKFQFIERLKVPCSAMIWILNIVIPVSAKLRQKVAESAPQFGAFEKVG